MLVTATPAGAVPFLEALSWPFSVPLFEYQGKPQVWFSGPDDDGVSVSFSFLKASSWLLAASSVLASEFLVV